MTDNSALMQKRRSDLDRRMTLRRLSSGIQKQQEIAFISDSMFYNMLLRGQQMKTKNSFIIYDFSSCGTTSSSHASTATPHCFSDSPNVIQMHKYQDLMDKLSACSLSRHPTDSLKIADISKHLSKEHEALFSKRLRMYNFIIPFSENSSEFSKAYHNTVTSFLKRHSDDIRIDELRNGGLLKVIEFFFFAQIQESLTSALASTSPSHSQEAKSCKAGLTFYSILKANKLRDIYVLNQGSSSLFKFYPFLPGYITNVTQTNTSSSAHHHDTLPNEVLAGRFFYGNWKHASSKVGFEATGITHVLNVTSEVHNYFEESEAASSLTHEVKYLRIDIEDTEDANIAQHFQKAFEFLNQALIANHSNKVFVHCAQGKSRSATMVCQFFMRLFNWTFSETIQYVSSLREIACPNAGFEEQLNEFEKRKYKFEGEEVKGECCEQLSVVRESLLLQAFSQDLQNVIQISKNQIESDEDDEEDYIAEGSTEHTILTMIHEKYEKRKSASTVESTSKEFDEDDELNSDAQQKTLTKQNPMTSATSQLTMKQS